VRRTRPELDVENVAELGSRGDERVEDRAAVVTVVLSSRLMAVDLNREAVDVERHIALPVAAVLGLEATGSPLQKEAAKDAAIVLGTKRLMQARKCRLRGETARRPIVVSERRHAAVVGDGDPESRVVAQKVGVVLVSPAERR